ncbi:MAG TPA: MFS transporter [Rudaea sp.]|nr:MFS transporter [Rudaea sp.]
MSNQQPPLAFWPIWNLCFGFFGIQFGLALQNANLSRIFQTLGADVEQIPALWIAAPLTGLLVQPIVGHYSDRTWGRFGRRRPYLAIGGALAALALIALPNASRLWVAAALLWVLDGGINVAMGPIRALIGDSLPPAQRPRGFAMQTFFISAGSVIASVLPWCLAQLGAANVAAPGGVPDSLRYAFYIGAAVTASALGWSAVAAREYAPAELATFTAPPAADIGMLPTTRLRRSGFAWCALGLAALAMLVLTGAEWQLDLIGAGALAYGAIELAVAAGGAPRLIRQLVADLHRMPATMRRLAPVQMCSWFALFAMWTYTTATVAQVHFAAKDTMSDAFNAGANWTGVLFAAYNAVTVVLAVQLPAMTRRLGLRGAHALNLVFGALGLASFALIRDPAWLLASMVGVGFAWTSILSVPYALLSDSVPAERMGAYMGIFNLFIVLPQLVAAGALGFVLRAWFGNAPLAALVAAAVALLAAAALTFRIREPDVSAPS